MFFINLGINVVVLLMVFVLYTRIDELSRTVTRLSRQLQPVPAQPAEGAVEPTPSSE